jgi:cytolysin-activating lysine-acyltransferase
MGHMRIGGAGVEMIEARGGPMRVVGPVGIGADAKPASGAPAKNAKITEQIRAGAFPVRLGVDDWTSGENVWLLDVVAGDRKQATSVLANFRQLAGDKPVKIHPIIGRLIDPAVLEKLRGA